MPSVDPDSDTSGVPHTVPGSECAFLDGWSSAARADPTGSLSAVRVAYTV
ncbi:hypothetical protein PC129_g23091 [Phytophthora cactorum]|uniref:Uncharacterized protein n=1 Tax=Phytophthora cactorum TaxID=29920 RepID=A0A8T1JGZ7_9STRA|nr:hypothetical protein Pcac1_g14740 [Phytophthora cactorum]KAG2774407.1 hypothetical protein Pcac1_g14750 [Phytophthora cactorum]KAG2873068.1 hypothetical protein PC114_g26039 [Phytophthora cactorum]KAG2884208.1 hypothetical protein PC117_g25858 [Phytophthora cactorum]KAG2969124.1 hypothetical protein PC119_g24018 [Phytophthora cactorum]